MEILWVRGEKAPDPYRVIFDHTAEDFIDEGDGTGIAGWAPIHRASHRKRWYAPGAVVEQLQPPLSLENLPVRIKLGDVGGKTGQVTLHSFIECWPREQPEAAFPPQLFEHSASCSASARSWFGGEAELRP